MDSRKTNNALLVIAEKQTDVIRTFIHILKKNSIPIPEGTYQIIEEISNDFYKIVSPEVKHSHFSPDNEAEPKFPFKIQSPFG